MRKLDHYWYSDNWVSTLLRPLSWCFRGMVAIRRWLYKKSLLESVKLPVPVIIVGNISVGGTGKTPLVIALVTLLKKHGYHPGVITRGYGGDKQAKPVLVTSDSDPYAVSDEAVLLAQRTQSPVVASPNRIASSKMLLAKGCDIIISDDGLQHYRLQRDVEIAVIDATRGFGNSYCLPAGPLREPQGRLNSVDLVVMNGDESKRNDDFMMQMHSHPPIKLVNGEESSVDDFAGSKVHAIAAVGNPQRFFDYLKLLGMTVIEHEFPDHHRYVTSEIEFDDSYPVFMTEKDAVKCRKLVDSEKYHYIAIDAELDTRFEPSIINLLAKTKTV
ncbi:MAG: tetraacyldisaccharide 4'-kinase [Thiotrichales bacterium]|nr:tetraacyldisaccharide 4'-kinase [Thiotrichales bacterium]